MFPVKAEARGIGCLRAAQGWGWSLETTLDQAETRNGRQSRMADYLGRLDFVVLDELGYLPSGTLECRNRPYLCQSARNGDPESACNRDPLVGLDGERPTGWSWSGLRSPVGRVG